MQFNVNTDEVIRLTNRLEQLSRSAFPNAVRGTLNTLALDVKKDTMPRLATEKFTNRQKNFFSSHSKVNFAKGFDLRTMKSEVGFYSKGNKDEQSVEDLEQQEHGGAIKGRSFIALTSARTSKSNAKLVQKRNRITAIRNMVDSKNANGVNDGQKMIKSIVFAGEKGHVLYKNTLFRVESMTRSKRSKRFKLTALYSFESGRDVKINRATHFMQKSSEKSYLKANEFYFKEANRQFNRIL